MKVHILAIKIDALYMLYVSEFPDDSM